MLKNNKKGFTIIEVVLVLAIAGLIFLMVFIALPALQRGQRNTQRRQDMSRFVSAVTEYAANNGGTLPFTGSLGMMGNPSTFDDESTDWVKKYIIAGNDEDFQDPDGLYYAFIKSSFPYSYQDDEGNASSLIESANNSTNNHHAIVVFSKHSCGNNEGYIKRASGERFFAMFMVLEGGAITCADNM